MLMAKTCKIKRHLGKKDNNKYSYKVFIYIKLTHPQSTFRLDVHYCQHSLVQNCIAYIFTRLCVRCNLQVQITRVCQ